MYRQNFACLSKDDAERGAYPLTSMQQAYWIGEQNGYRLGTAACLYRGYRAATLDLGRLEQALLQLMATHPALRTRILPDGTQCIAQMPARCQVPVRDIRHLGVAEQEALAAGWKDALDKHLADMADGCQFVCRADRVHDGYRLHFLFRLLTLDGRSLALFFHDLTRLYRGDAPHDAPSADYREYVEEQHATRLEPRLPAVPRLLDPAARHAAPGAGPADTRPRGDSPPIDLPPPSGPAGAGGGPADHAAGQDARRDAQRDAVHLVRGRAAALVAQSVVHAEPADIRTPGQRRLASTGSSVTSAIPCCWKCRRRKAVFASG